MIFRVCICIGITIAVLISSVYSEDAKTEQLEKKVYAHIDTDSIVLASSQKIYLEEFDSFTRPIAATLWEKEAIIQQIKYMYEEESQHPVKKIITDKNFIREEVFDTKGGLLSVEVKDSGSLVIEKTLWVRDLEDRLVSLTHTQNSVTHRTEWEYAEGDTIYEKRIFKGQTLVSRSIYSDNDNWVETIFHNSVPVLTVQWIDGVRVNEVKK